MSAVIDTPDRPAGAPGPSSMRRQRLARNSLFAQGEPMIWLTGGALAVSLFMIVGLLLFVLWMGARTFWPGPVLEIETASGATLLGELDRVESYRPSSETFDAMPGPAAERARAEADRRKGLVARRLIRTERTSDHFEWVDDAMIVETRRPRWAFVIERRSGGRLYGSPESFFVEGKQHADTAEAAWAAAQEQLPAVRDRLSQRRALERNGLGELNRKEERARLALRAVELRKPADADDAAWQKEYARAKARLEQIEAESRKEAQRIQFEIDTLDAANARYELSVATPGGSERVPLADIVRAYPANQLSWFDKLGVYVSRWSEFLFDEPREANSEGGVWPAIVGTVIMTLFMSLAVAPFGVAAALYLREYAKAGPLVSAVRISINNLAGVPSIVFGVFGLGFFCYFVGGELIDPNLFQERLPNPTFGKGALVWASLTLALLTLPVVIVATEEALAAVPNSVREGSYACGASKWQTLRRIVLPRAMPGIMTGMILAMARGAGEVAPLMLVGAVKLAPDLPIDGMFPFVHLDRSFMHLGFHIYDLGFQSQNSNAARPMVFTTSLLLISVIAFLNITAVVVRARLKRRFASSQF